jgi:magnesium-protoporphyrin O-methyltransferase
MIPHNPRDVDRAFRAAGLDGNLTQIERVTSGFYISNALVFEGDLS